MLKLFGAMMGVSILGEVTIILLLFVTDMNRVLEERWKHLSSQKTQQIENNWQCTGFEECKNVAINKARRYEALTLSIAIAIVTYQVGMILASYFYVRGLNKKQYRITVFTKKEKELTTKDDKKNQKRSSQNES
ncbi:hypothetical protein RFI_17261 [Reticulomyxa filosa]|uniref:Uncharacterized protein n=1 Tax=Reticulomyxa filosa TaxID=46433 RepID=X6N2K6_RETFI|nr:hypothetical protein RFI_17261 [Reticulomyxa filosa]|eukprot:ETO19959.1 hypothetical protein RFI_17261 [Reticulomyxa filosa]